jgi:ubiquinone/menaquinone biosynthesis C-methylase UbiE
MNDYLKTQYDKNDPALISVIDDLSFWSAPFGLKLLDTVRYRKNICALDIGFGLGFPLIDLAMRLGPSSKVYGIDPWKVGIERARLKLKYTGVRNVELVEGVAEAMPFEKDIFDLIVSNNGINNVQDMGKTFAECNRVARLGAQFVFTFNTEHTFVEFYDIFRKTLKENNVQEYETKIDAHIYSKRKPLPEIKSALLASGFRVNTLQEDEFSYHFSDGTSMLNHFSMKLAFMDAWKEIVPASLQAKIFRQVEDTMNLVAKRENGFSMKVPFVTIDSEKIKHTN